MSILVIDDASNDKTFDISKNFKEKKLVLFLTTLKILLIGLWRQSESGFFYN